MRKSLVVPLLAALAGCAFQSYSSKPIDAQQTAAAFDERSVTDPSLREYLQSHGVVEWPVANWGLHELTLLAFYYHPDLELARANAALARAQEFTARQPLNPGFEVLPEYHSLTEWRSPWSLHFQAQIPVVTQGKREIAAEQAGYLAQAAELNVGNTAWQVRNRLRSRLLDAFAAREDLRLLRAESADRNETLKLLEKRVAVGMIASHETAIARERALDAALRLERRQGQLEEALAGIAEALGLPQREARSLELKLDAFREAPPIDDFAAAKREALINRLDIRRSLLEYAAAEAALQLEIARQYPDFNLKPGYAFDQDDNVWSLGLALVLPLLNKNEGPIREAQERREIKAREFLALQSQVIAQSESAATRYEAARAELLKAEELTRLAEVQNEATKSRFDAGEADRLDLVNARLAVTSAQQAKTAAAIRLQHARGALEDALQRPVFTGAFDLPAVTRR
ncbi:MAG: TolC family protein [Burkholderiales bacterium]